MTSLKIVKNAPEIDDLIKIPRAKHARLLGGGGNCDWRSKWRKLTDEILIKGRVWANDGDGNTH